MDHPKDLPPDSELSSLGYKLCETIQTPKLVVEMLAQDLPPGGMFLASWGHMMVVKEGDFMVGVGPSGGLREVYRIERTGFEDSHQALEVERSEGAEETAAAETHDL